MTNLLDLHKTYEELRGAARKAPRAASEETEQTPQNEEGEPAAAPHEAAQAPAAARAHFPRPDRTDPAAPPAVAPPAAVPRARAAATTELAAEELYTRALSGVCRMFEAAVMQEITPGRLLVAVQELERLCPDLVASTVGSRGLLRKAMETYAEGEGFVLPHSVNVAILGVELGNELGMAAAALPDLCLAGLVHDLGSVRLPPGLLTKAESLTPDEWEAVRARPQNTHDMIMGLHERYARVARIVRQVYERLDGSGYPEGLQGDDILREALVLGTVDFFESFAHPRPYKATLPGTANHGIQMLMQMADKFGSATLKALVGSVGLFPIGSYVRLSSAEIGRVVDVKKENPMRPEVEILLDAERRVPRTPRTLDLLSIPHIYVARALTASDLRELGLLPKPHSVAYPGPAGGKE